MKGNTRLIGALNGLLADELTAISQYMVHSEMCDSWGFEKLHKAIETQAKEEMQHAESLIKRILFLEGTPVLSKLHQIKIGKDVKQMVANDEQSELDAIHSYNGAIALAGDVNDQASADLLTGILKMEETHLEWNEIQRAQIDQIGLENYLANQT